MNVFIPGVGFRPNNGLTLREPVTIMAGDGRGIRVTRLISTDATELAFEVRDDDRDRAAREGRVDYRWAERSEVWLRTEDGTTLARRTGPGNGTSMGQHEFGFFGQKVVFDPLPSLSRRVMLGVHGELGAWDVPLELVPLPESAVTRAIAIDAGHELHGVVVRVVEMAVTDDATIIELEADPGPTATAVDIGEWPPKPDDDGFALIDADGSRLQEISRRDRFGMRRPGRTVVTFPRTESRSLTVEVPAVVFQDSEGTLDFDLPIFAPTDVDFGRYAMRVRYAAAVDRLATAPGEEAKPGLEIQIGDGEWRDGRRVVQPGPVFVDGVHHGWTITAGTDEGTLRVNIPLPDAGSARHISMRRPVVKVHGPWRISFSRP